MGNNLLKKKMKFTIALIASASAVMIGKPLIHPQTGLATTTTGQHWYGQPPLAMAELEKPLIHPQTGLAITTTGQHWYGQPPLAMAQDEEEQTVRKNGKSTLTTESYMTPPRIGFE